MYSCRRQSLPCPAHFPIGFAVRSNDRIWHVFIFQFLINAQKRPIVQAVNGAELATQVVKSRAQHQY
jgi:hypothetical protein